MTALDTIVAGISCREVLADLSDFMDGALPDARVAQLQAHVAGCTVCERFGDQVADAVAALRRASPAPSLPVGAGDRLRARLSQER